MELSMLKKHIFTGLCIGFFAVFFAPSPLGAATVSILVMEAGQSRENQGGQYPILWENGLLEIFFDAGHIVSNSPRLQINEKPDDDFPPEAERDFNNAQEGGMEYFLVAIVDYTGSNVSLRLFNTKSSKMIHEQRYAASTFRSSKEEYEKIKKAVRPMTAHLR